MTLTALDKRIKRRITARSHSFFAVCAPGLSSLCLAELKDLENRLCLDLSPLVQAEGGVEFQGRVHDAFAANLFLRTPSRILMRMAGFRAENFRDLERHLNGLEWELFLQPGTRFSVKASSRKSRLYHCGAIAQRARDIISGRMGSPPEKDGEAQDRGGQAVHLRADQDRFEVSLDSSGHLLHRRGLKQDVGAAPLRETLAAAVLMLSGYTGREALLDPMCGSGTFALEGVMIRRNIPPGFFRTFAFEAWPCFSTARWNHMKSQAGQGILKDLDPMITASDLDGARVKSLAETMGSRPELSGVRVLEQDFFQIPRHGDASRPGVVVLNPPYGLRLTAESGTEELYRSVGRKLCRDFPGWKAGVVLPDRSLARHLPFSVSLSPLFHGGLDLTLATARIP